MTVSRKSIIKVILFIFLISALWFPAEAEAGREWPLILPRVYKVKKGDSLAGIARRFYGEVSKWTLIYEANKDKIKDPNKIEPGIELTIPQAKEDFSQGEKEGKLAGQKDEKIKRFQRVQQQKEEIERKATIENLYRIGKKYYQSRNYPDAACAFGEMLTFDPENKNALRYYEKCQQKIKREEVVQLLARRQEQLLRQKQNQPGLAKEAHEKTGISQEERKRKQKELAKAAEKERLRKETGKKEKSAQIESAYKETQKVYIEAKNKFEKAAKLEKDLGLTSATRAQEKALAHNRDVIKEEPQVLEYTISEEDMLYIHIWEEETLSQEVIVRPDGKISFPLAGDIPAAGLTFPQLKEELTKRLKEYIKYPVISISLRKLGGKKIIVLGEVGSPGVYSVAGKKTVLEAIALAGGFTLDAVPASVILIRGGLQSPEGKRLNLNRAIKKADMGQNVALHPEDIIYVPKKFIANVNYALSQILGPISQGVNASKMITDW